MILPNLFFSHSVPGPDPNSIPVTLFDLHPLRFRLKSDNPKIDCSIVLNFYPDQIRKESGNEKRIWIHCPTRGWGYLIQVDNDTWRFAKGSCVCVLCDPRFTKMPGWRVRKSSTPKCPHTIVLRLYEKNAMDNTGGTAKIAANINQESDSYALIEKIINNIPEDRRDFSMYTNMHDLHCAALSRWAGLSMIEEKNLIKSNMDNTELMYHTERVLDAIVKKQSDVVRNKLVSWLQAKIFYASKFDSMYNKHIFEKKQDDFFGGCIDCMRSTKMSCGTFPADIAWAERIGLVWKHQASESDIIIQDRINLTKGFCVYVDPAKLEIDWKTTKDNAWIEKQVAVKLYRAGELPLLPSEKYAVFKQAERAVVEKLQK